MEASVEELHMKIADLEWELHTLVGAIIKTKDLEKLKSLVREVYPGQSKCYENIGQRNKMSRKTAYNEKYDAYYYVSTGEWVEPKCSDPDCEFCKNRPEKNTGHATNPPGCA